MSDRDDPLDDVVEEHDLGVVDRDEPGRLARVRAWFSRDGDDESATDGEPADDGPGALTRARERIVPVVTSSAAKKFYFAVGVLVVAVGAFWYTLQTTGIVGAILYSFLFIMFATVFPIGINLLGNITPNGIGQLHLLLGAVAFDHHYLVQRERGWEWCPGERGRVWIDGEWHDVTGEDKYSILGWRPFGILRYKDDETWAEQRADTAGLKARGSFEKDPSQKHDDGPVKRGGFEEVEPPAITGTEGTWVLDLKRMFTDGVRKIGDIELIETAEEVIERGEVDDGSMSNMGPMVRVFGGMLLGVVSMFGYLFLMG